MEALKRIVEIRAGVSAFVHVGAKHLLKSLREPDLPSNDLALAVYDSLNRERASPSTARSGTLPAIQILFVENARLLQAEHLCHLFTYYLKTPMIPISLPTSQLLV